MSRKKEEDADWKMIVIRPTGETEERTWKGYARACREARNERFRSDKMNPDARARIIIAREF